MNKLNEKYKILILIISIILIPIIYIIIKNIVISAFLEFIFIFIIYEIFKRKQIYMNNKFKSTPNINNNILDIKQNNTHISYNTHYINNKNIDYLLEEQEKKINQIKNEYLNNINMPIDNETILNDFLKNNNIQLYEIDFIRSTNITFVSNQNRKQYFIQLNDLLKRYDISYDTLYKILDNFKEVLFKIEDLEYKIKNKTNVNILKELNTKNIIDHNNKILKEYENYLIEIGDMYNSEYNIIKSGLIGEENVNNELNKYSDLFINIPNVRFEVDGVSVESDNLLITPYGVFIIEVKNFADRHKLKIEKNGEWKKVFSGFEEKIVNVTNQVKRHIKYKELVINQHLSNKGIDKIKIKPIIVIANDNVEIINLSKMPVLKVNKLYDYITSQEITLDNTKIQAIKNIVLDKNLPSKVYPIDDIRKYILSLIDYLQANLRYFNSLYYELENLNKNLK